MDEALFWFVAFMTLLLVMFLYAVITTPPQDAAPSGPPSREPSEVTAPAPPWPVRRPQAVSPTGAGGQPGEANYAARHTTGAVPTAPAPKVSSNPPPVPVRMATPVRAGLAAAGLVLVVTGGWLLIGAGKAAACSHQAAAICSQGPVVLTATQLVGGAVFLAGVALVFTVLALSLRWPSHVLGWHLARTKETGRASGTCRQG